MNLIEWDADFYNAIPDETLEISLTRKQIYLLGQATEFMAWKTRWTGDISAMDLDAIRSDADFALLDEIEGGGVMSCEDVADCIETSEIVQSAITENVLQSGGYAPVPDTNLTEGSPPPVLSSSAKNSSILPPDVVAACDSQPQLLMGLARTIVRELDETVTDFLELLEYASNTLEAWASVSSALPSAVTSVITQGLDWLDWVMEVLSELYSAAYTQNVEDELTCAIFCYMMDNCDLSLAALGEIYAGEASIGSPPSDNIIDVLEFIYTVATDADKIAVAAAHYQILRLIEWGAFASFSAAYLKALLASAQGADYSYESLCDDCPPDEIPDTYWRMYKDFRVSESGMVAKSGSGFYGATYQQGWLTPIPTNVTGQTGVDVMLADLGDSYQLVGVAVETQRRGSTGNGTTDTSGLFLYPNINAGGTLINYWGVGFVTDNSNNIIHGQNNVLSPSAAARSMVLRARVGGGASAAGTRFARILRLVIYGLPLDSGTKKPPSSVWVSSVPSTPDEMLNG